MTVVVSDYEVRLWAEEWQRRCDAGKPYGWGPFMRFPLLPPIPVAPWECRIQAMDDGDLYGSAYTFKRPIRAQDLGL